MHAYLFCLLLGFAGLVAMAAMGAFGHGGDHDHAGGDTGGVDIHAGNAGGHGDFGHHAGDADSVAAGHADAHGHAGHDAAEAHGPPAGHTHAGEHAHDAGVARAVLAWLSPRVAFSVLVGVGAVGTVLRPLLPAPAVLALALGGGVAFERALVGPLWKFVFRFASRPAATLEDALFERAEAVTAFNAAGEGIVRVRLDGQVRQVLAQLRPEEVGSGVRVRAGDVVRVEEVDAARGRFVVSYLGRLPAETG